MGVIGSIIGKNSGFQLFVQSNNDPGEYADATARDVYFGANPLELARLDANQFLIIRLDDDGAGSVAYQQRAGSNWVDVTSLIQGLTGPAGATGNSYFFNSIADRDTFFGTVPNEGLLRNGLPVVVNIGGNTASLFLWNGATAPVSYDNSKWILSSLEVSSGTLFLGKSGASISSGAELLNFTEAGGDTAYLIGVAYDDTGSYQPNYWKLPAISLIILADVDTDTLSDPQTLSVTNTSDVYVKEYTLTPATSGELRVQTWLGTDETGPGLVDTYITVDPGDIGNPTVFQAPNNTMVLTGQQTYTKFSGVQLKGGLQTTGPFTGQTVPATALGAWAAERVDLVTQFEDDINLKSPDGTTISKLNFLDSSDTLKGILSYDPNTDIFKLDSTNGVYITDGVIITNGSSTSLNLVPPSPTSVPEFLLRTSVGGTAFSIARSSDTAKTVINNYVGDLDINSVDTEIVNITSGVNINNSSGTSINITPKDSDSDPLLSLNQSTGAPGFFITRTSNTSDTDLVNFVGDLKLGNAGSGNIVLEPSSGNVNIMNTTFDFSNLTLNAPNGVASFTQLFKNFAGTTKGSIGDDQGTGLFKIEAPAGDFEIISSAGDLNISSTGTTIIDSLTIDSSGNAEFSGEVTATDFITSSSSIRTPFGGFGVLQNYLKYSQEFDNAIWVRSGDGAPTVSPNSMIAPDGTLTADTINFPVSDFGFIIQSNLGTADSTVYNVSFWAKHLSGSNAFIFDMHNGSHSGLITIGSDWKRYTKTITSGGGEDNIRISDLGPSSYAFWGWQISDETTTLPYSRTDATNLPVATSGCTVTNELKVKSLDTDGNAKFSGSIKLTPITAPTYAEGQVWYDSVTKGHILDTGYTDVRLNAGRETHIEVYNSTASQINNGDPVSVIGTITGGLPDVTPMDSSSILLALGFTGVATMDIPAGTAGVVTNFGKVHDVPTGALALGFIYANSTGWYTQVRPKYPEQRLLVGGVIKTGASDGILSIGSRLIPRRNASRSYSFTSSGVGAGTFYKGGFYDWATGNTALTQASLTQAYGTVGRTYAAHVGIVPSAAGVVDTGQVGLRVTGIEDSEAGVQVAAQTGIITDDITTLTTNVMAETEEKFSGQVTLELYVVSGSPVNYSLTFNYGYSKYEDMQNQDFTITALECIWKGNSTDANFDIALKHHSPIGWTYAVSGFVPGNGDIARKTVDQALAGSVVNGQDGGWKRIGLDLFVNGNALEGVLFEIITTQNNTIQTMDLHIAGFSEEL